MHPRPHWELTALPDPLAGKGEGKGGEREGGEGRKDEDGDGWEGRGGCLLLNLSLATLLVDVLFRVRIKNNRVVNRILATRYESSYTKCRRQLLS